MYCAVHNTFYYKEESTFSIECTVPLTTLSIQNTLYGKCYGLLKTNKHIIYSKSNTMSYMFEV